MTDVVRTLPRAGDAIPASIREDFPILETRYEEGPFVYLDNAATTQKPRAVLDALLDYYSTANSNIGRGYYRMAFESTERYEQAREVVRETLNAERADEVVFTKSTTDSLNLLVDTFGRQVVRAGDQVVITGMEHNSNLLTWRRLCERVGAELVVVPTDERGRVGAEHFAAALGPRVRLAAIAHVSNVLGTLNPVREMTAAAHRRDIPVVVDGAQAVAHRRVDVRELDADFYCFSAHKVYGPMGTGVLYGRWELLSELPPYQVGGGTVKGITLTDPVRYVPAPARLEGGTPHVAGAVGLAAALRYLQGIGWDAVQAHDELLVRRAVQALEEVKGVRVIGDPATSPSGIVSLVVDGIHPYDVGGHLDRHGVAVRAGVHCANAFLDSMGLLGTVRMSFGVYNTEEEIEVVRDALRALEPGMWTREHPTERFP